MTAARALAVSVAAGVALLAALATGAAAAAPEDVANDISQQVMSPYCPGVTLHDCPSDEALELRATIASWVQDGWSRARIMARLESEYGAEILGAPRPEGTGLLAWAAPLVLLAAGAGAVVVLAGRWSRRSAPPPRPISRAQRARVERELAAVDPPSPSPERSP